LLNKENAIAFNYLRVKVHGAALSNEVIGLESEEKRCKPA
jgi:hypothetical protein